MYTSKRFQVQEWICNQQEYFWLEILLVSSSSCNIIFDKEFRDHVFWYMCTCFMLKLENMLVVNILIYLQIYVLINYVDISSLSLYYFQIYLISFGRYSY